MPVTTQVHKGSVFLAGGWTSVCFIWIKAQNISWFLGILFMEEAAEKVGAFQL